MSVVMLERAADELAPFLSEVAFVGGATIVLWITDPGAPEPRPTNDVDLVAEVASRLAWHDFEERLRAQGLRNDSSSQVICRWIVGTGDDELLVDLMPTDASILGFENRWQRPALEGPSDVVVSPTGTIFVLDGGNYRIQKFGEGGAPIPKGPGGPGQDPKTPPPPKKRTSSIWRLIPPGPGCETKNGQMCFVEIVIPEPGDVTAETPPRAKGATVAAKRKKAKPGIQRVKRRVTKAGKIRLQLKLNKAAKKVVRRKGKVAVRVRLTFKPKAGKAVSTTRTFTFKKKAKKRAKN